MITGLVVTPGKAAVGHRKAPSALGLDDGGAGTLQFTVKERYSNGYEEDVTDRCTWSTTSTIGTIDGKGLFTADPAVKYIEGAEVKAVRNGREGKTTIAVGLVEIPAITPKPGGNCDTVNLRVDPLYSDFYDKKTLIEQVDSFYIGQYAVTNREYCEFLNDVTEGGVRNPAEGDTNWWKDTSADDLEAGYNGIVPDGAAFKVKDGYADRPVIYVSWYSAAAFCNWLSKKHGMADSDLCYGGYSANGLERWGKDGNNAPDGSNYHSDRKGYRLATDVEWEYACRIRKSDGTLSTDFYYWGNTLDDANEDDYWKYIWFFGSSDPLGVTINPRIVGTRRPNGIGLYDMLGNQWEFVSDWYGTYTIPSNEFGSGSATRIPKARRQAPTTPS